MVFGSYGEVDDRSDSVAVADRANLFEAFRHDASPPCLDLSMTAAVQSGPTMGLGPGMGGLRPLQGLLHHGVGAADGPGLMHHPADNPPNPEVLLALLSRNKGLEGNLFKFNRFS